MFLKTVCYVENVRLIRFVFAQNLNISDTQVDTSGLKP